MFQYQVISTNSSNRSHDSWIQMQYIWATQLYCLKVYSDQVISQRFHYFGRLSKLSGFFVNSNQDCLLSFDTGNTTSSLINRPNLLSIDTAVIGTKGNVFSTTNHQTICTNTRCILESSNNGINLWSWDLNLTIFTVKPADAAQSEPSCP